MKYTTTLTLLLLLAIAGSSLPAAASSDRPTKTQRKLSAPCGLLESGRFRITMPLPGAGRGKGAGWAIDTRNGQSEMVSAERDSSKNLCTVYYITNKRADARVKIRYNYMNGVVTIDYYVGDNHVMTQGGNYKHVAPIPNPR